MSNLTSALGAKKPSYGPFVRTELITFVEEGKEVGGEYGL